MRAETGDPAVWPRMIGEGSPGSTNEGVIPGRPSVLWTLALAASTAVLALSGSAFPSPPGWSPSALAEWATTTDPIPVVASVLRLGAAVVVSYLAAITLLGWIADLFGSRRLRRLLHAVALPGVRRLVGAAAGVTLGVLPVAPAALAQPPAAPAAEVSAQPPEPVASHPTPAPRPPEPVVMRRLDTSAPSPDADAGESPPASEQRPAPPEPATTTRPADASGASEPIDATPDLPASPTPPAALEPGDAEPSVTMRVVGAPAPGVADRESQVGPAVPEVAVMRLLGPVEATPTVEPVLEPDGPVMPAAPTPAVATAEQTYTLQPGDHLWKVSRLTLQRARSMPPTDAEIAAYVEAIVEQNRDVLVVHGQPDLVYPGQVFVLPPVAP